MASAVGREQIRRIEIDRRIGGAARRIDIDDLDVFADRPGLEIVLPRISIVTPLMPARSY